MLISHAMAAQLENSSWIRRMFEAGLQLRRERGVENVYDFSLGNPDLEPPEAVMSALRRVAAENRPHSHAYMPNAGYPEVREIIARRLAARSGVSYFAADILMTNGAAGAINTLLKAILDPGDEVLVLSPYFPEYRFYIENHGGRMVTVETGERFQPEAPRIAAAVTPRTRAPILNSPNNPTGTVYGEAVLRGIDRALPRVERLPCARTVAARTLCYIIAPPIWQRVMAAEPEAVIDVPEYRSRRDLLCDALARMGYDVARPEGSFYVFPRTPMPDDVAF